MKTTVNYGLRKPDYTDPADIADFNSNTDVIDGKLKEHETQLANKMNKQIKDDVTLDKYEFGFLNGEFYYRKVIS